MFAPSYHLAIPEEYLDNRDPHDFIALRVIGDSAYPLYHDDDALLIDTAAVPQTGSPVVVRCQNSLQLGTIGQGLFQPLDPCLPPTDHFHTVGVPALLIRRFE